MSGKKSTRFREFVRDLTFIILDEVGRKLRKDVPPPWATELKSELEEMSSKLEEDLDGLKEDLDGLKEDLAKLSSSMIRSQDTLHDIRRELRRREEDAQYVSQDRRLGVRRARLGYNGFRGSKPQY